MPVLLKKLIAAALCVCLLMTMPGGTIVFANRGGTAFRGDIALSEEEARTTATEGGELHFIIRHWHSAESTGNFQGSEIATNGDRYFVVGEGYIVPVNGGYEFYLVYQSGDQKGKRKRITAASSEYVESIDEKNGSITLTPNPVMNNDGTPAERFSTFSVSAGHTAVTYEGSNLVITYDPYVHLVKAHAFYIRETMDVNGTADTTVFGGAGVVTDPEQDTVWVYTYISDHTDGNGFHKAGEIAKDSQGKPYKKGDALPSDVQNNVWLTKLYNTTEGLHTDKTASITANGDGRTFDLDLETWYAEGYAPQVGMVLDASGSMAFTSDTPEEIRLTQSEIAALGINQLPDVTGRTGEPGGGWSDYFLTDGQIDQILDKTHTDNSRLSASGYSYFVYDTDKSTLEYAPLGYWEGVSASGDDHGSNASGVAPTVARTADNRVLGSINTRNSSDTATAVLNHTEAGWYYVTHAGNWNNHYANEKYLTGKRLIGIPGSKPGDPFTDLITLPDGSTVGTGYTYQPSSDTPIRFYVDSDGILCCFFSRSNRDTPMCSYVYELGDSEYVKTESLQRALGIFVTELNEISPSAEVSAVRFSLSDSDIDNNLDKLVLLDWTNNAGESAGILSLRRGEGGALDFESGPHGVKEYNYGLTGGTSTFRGLQAFINHLQPYDYTGDQDQNNDSGAKYLILFTDGEDSHIGNTNGDQDKAEKLANDLKRDGYTIFTVMLNGGPVQAGTEQYQKASSFLISLSGNSSTTTDGEREDYFYSVSKARDKLEGRGEDTTGLNDADILMRIFTEEILDEIANPLGGYTITDYIDPRFDLVDADGTVWHLNTKGAVVKGEGSNAETISVSSTSKITISLSDVSDQEAREPYLRYNKDKDMYYLEWVTQTIPGSAIGAERLAVWNARVTIRAKNDFIGGNAVLTNGNAEKMNWVYHPGDTDASSGTNDTVRNSNTDDMLDEYPSRGFPRTVVNVVPSHEDLIHGQTVFMGEMLNENFVIQRFFDAACKEGEDSEFAKYYWEYLVRYAKHTGQDIDKLMEIIATGEELSIPYSYIPNAEGTSQTGTKDHEKDQLGYLAYRIVEADTEDSVTKDRRNRVAKLTVAFEPLPVASTTVGTAISQTPADRTAANKALVSDVAYAWDPQYKPANNTVGKVQENRILVNGMYYTKIVSGEVRLQCDLSPEIAAALQGSTVTYTVDLMREYDGIKEKIGTFEIILEHFSGEAALYTAAFTPDEDYAYMGYDAQRDVEYGLPIGTYMLVNGAGTVMRGDSVVSGYTFSQAAVVPNAGKDSPYAQNGLFTKGSGYDDPELEKKFVATTDTEKNQIVLGDKTAAASSGRDYTDYRFGLFRVSVSEDNDPEENTTTTNDPADETETSVDETEASAEETETSAEETEILVEETTEKEAESYEGEKPDDDTSESRYDDQEAIPEMGDSNSIGLWIALSVVSFFGIIVCLISMKKSGDRKNRRKE